MRQYFGVKGIDTAWNKRSIADKVREAIKSHLSTGGHAGWWTLQCVAKNTAQQARTVCRT